MAATARIYRPTPANLARLAGVLVRGGLVAVPTETVYGLAADALNPAACRRIFRAKGRPTTDPLIVHVLGLAQAGRIAVLNASARRLAAAFWPGPLTLVLERSPLIPDAVTAGGNTVGLRWPGHPFMQAVIRACGFPLAAPSANLSNQISPTNSEHVRRQLGDQLPLIVDGGQAQVGIESTVLDLTVTPARILRPGMIHAEAIAAVLGNLADTAGAAQESKLKSPGLLAKHYSPRAKLVILKWDDDASLRTQVAGYSVAPAQCQIIAHTRIPASFGADNVSVIPHDAEAFARALYGEMHRCDAAGARLIVVEAPPESPEWSGILDRLRRAAA